MQQDPKVRSGPNSVRHWSQAQQRCLSRAYTERGGGRGALWTSWDLRQAIPPPQPPYGPSYLSGKGRLASMSQPIPHSTGCMSDPAGEGPLNPDSQLSMPFFCQGQAWDSSSSAPLPLLGPRRAPLMCSAGHKERPGRTTTFQQPAAQLRILGPKLRALDKINAEPCVRAMRDWN
ncbi:hypothetical protein NDU88_003694 [Pleurodeles waltl]|uniref:Uncharacterized protein n=1 Tax=Pleurodeles waltl TaxID=8319 RepID=A0AAV7PCT5_PLEWA|nr:hypothetical protein NDU88_003694 [Pleurodeles waltl]